jgi:hypothetical protein
MAIGLPTVDKTEEFLQVLCELFSSLDTGLLTNQMFKEALVFKLRSTGGVNIPDPLFHFNQVEGPFWSTPDAGEMLHFIQQVEMATLQKIADFMQEMVDRREQRGDPWLEGRLELGVAYTVLGDYDRARSVLSQLVRISEGGGVFAEEMMMAA